LLTVSLLVVAKSPASATSGVDSSPRVQVAAAEAPPSPPPAQTPLVDDSPRSSLQAPARAAPLPDRQPVTPASLRQLVALHAASARPVSPQTACMARTVYLEASNQTLRGQLAVAQVIVNRMRSSAYPKSACEVVDQPGQFAQADGDQDPAGSKRWRTAVAIARIAQDSRVPQVAPGAKFFHATYVNPSWSQTHERIAQIGDHVFYR
jgi:spore germination cell wall hydrolase CwlJ-like protein